SVTATAGGQTYTSTDPSYSQGFVPVVHVQKAINAVDPLHPTTIEDANDPAHPVMLADGTAVTWTYLVTDLLTTPLTFVSLVDDAGTPTTPVDDFAPAPVLSGGFNVGDTNHNNTLDFGEAWLYTSAGVRSYQAKTGLYGNTATVTVTSGGQLVSAS